MNILLSNRINLSYMLRYLFIIIKKGHVPTNFTIVVFTNVSYSSSALNLRGCYLQLNFICKFKILSETMTKIVFICMEK